MQRRKFIRDRTGEGHVDVAIAIIIIFAVIAGIFSLFPIYTTYQTLNATARQIAHVVEVCGQADEATVALATGREGFIEPDNSTFDVVWHNATAKKIQPKTPFTVTISKQVLIPILRPITGSPVGIKPILPDLGIVNTNAMNWYAGKDIVVTATVVNYPSATFPPSRCGLPSAAGAARKPYRFRATEPTSPCSG